jgi:tetratricopeptide (TPR) repeat protein
MPALKLLGRISAISLFVALQTASQAQPAGSAPQPPETNFAAAAPVNAPFGDTAKASLPSITDEQQGDLLMLQQRYQAALEAYAKVAQPSATLWNEMGIAYQMMYDSKHATRCYKASLKLDPNQTGALNNLATLEDAGKNYSTAERLYRKALKVNPASARVFKNLGTNLLMQHKYNESSEAYSQALALDPQIFDKYSGPTVEARVSVKDRGEESYIWARNCARAGLNDCAIAQLRKAFDEGSTTTKQVANDKDFEAVRQTHDYERLLAEEQ